jgi:hypothetical protein
VPVAEHSDDILNVHPSLTCLIEVSSEITSLHWLSLSQLDFSPSVSESLAMNIRIKDNPFVQQLEKELLPNRSNYPWIQQQEQVKVHSCSFQHSPKNLFATAVNNNYISARLKEEYLLNLLAQNPSPSADGFNNNLLASIHSVTSPNDHTFIGANPHHRNYLLAQLQTINRLGLIQHYPQVNQTDLLAPKNASPSVATDVCLEHRDASILKPDQERTAYLLLADQQRYHDLLMHQQIRQQQLLQQQRQPRPLVPLMTGTHSNPFHEQLMFRQTQAVSSLDPRIMRQMAFEQSSALQLNVDGMTLSSMNCTQWMPCMNGQDSEPRRYSKSFKKARIDNIN